MNYPYSRQQPASAQYVLPETVAIAIIGLLDMCSTVYLLATGRAAEANPLLAAVLGTFGIAGFIIAKALLIGGPVAGLEWARSRKPEFVRFALRLGIILYLGVYILGVLQINSHALAASGILDSFLQ